MAVKAGRPPREPDAPLQRAARDGVDLRRRRRDGVRPLRQPDLGERSSPRSVSSRAGGRSPSRLAWRRRPRCSTSSPSARRSSRRGTATRERWCSSPTRAARAGQGGAGRHRRHRAGCRCVGRQQRNDRAALDRVADQPGARGGRHPDTVRGGSSSRRAGRRRQHIRDAARPTTARRSAPTSSLHSGTKYLSGHSDALIGRRRHARRPDLPRARREAAHARRTARHVGGVARAARPAHPGPSRRAGDRKRARAGSPARGASGRRPRPLPGLRRDHRDRGGRRRRRCRRRHARRPRCGFTRPASAGSSRRWSDGADGRASR